MGDVDVLVTGPGAKEALDRFVKHPRVGEILGHGDTRASARVGIEGLQVDVRAVPTESFGAALQYFTGSKTHNVALRQLALKQGYTLLTPLENRSAIVTVRTKRESKELGEALAKARIDVTVRESEVRVSPGIFNTSDDVDRLLTVLREAVRK